MAIGNDATVGLPISTSESRRSSNHRLRQQLGSSGGVAMARRRTGKEEHDGEVAERKKMRRGWRLPPETAAATSRVCSIQSSASMMSNGGFCLEPDGTTMAQWCKVTTGEMAAAGGRIREVSG
ncbi:unnamed protein product [Lactuca virosa]|uniref:Uncharacterized protein n=1 Tax=Lactuca virosa TaxID=75947 RepID=A0AAU9NX76_9ASTR|nr:unnamed protein product [Lactuca virosa]